MIVSIHQPQYLPWLGYFDKIIRSDVFVLLDNVQFKKNDWQNRNKIKTSQGAQWITVPIIHDFGQSISDTQTNNTVNWKEEHLKTLTINYSKSKYFKKYISLFEEAYTQEWEFLSDINIYLIKKLAKVLCIDTKIVRSSDYDTTDERTIRLVDLCKTFNADTYLSGIDGNKYMDFEIFKQNNINIVTQEYNHPVYSQLFCKKDKNAFEPNMSIVDLIFNCGEKSKDIITI
ncbi:MAG: WbqC family protein [Candidatus Omnitrophica bacterium]|nr:WbqC family protein [Candidatus Omnitrophota bacterium]